MSRTRPLSAGRKQTKLKRTEPSSFDQSDSQLICSMAKRTATEQNISDGDGKKVSPTKPIAVEHKRVLFWQPDFKSKK